MKQTQTQTQTPASAADLPAPVVDDAHDGQLDGKLPHTTVTVPQSANLKARDIITLRWTLPNGEVFASGHVVSASEANQAVTLPVDADTIRACQGWKVVVSYLVGRRPGGVSVSSAETAVQVTGWTWRTCDFEGMRDGQVYSPLKPLWMPDFLFVPTALAGVSQQPPNLAPEPWIHDECMITGSDFACAAIVPLRPCYAISAGCWALTFEEFSSIDAYTYVGLEPEPRKKTFANPDWVEGSSDTPLRCLSIRYRAGITANSHLDNIELAADWADSPLPPVLSVDFDDVPGVIPFGASAPLLLEHLVLVSDKGTGEIDVDSGHLRQASHEPYVGGKCATTLGRGLHVALRRPCRSISIGYFSDRSDVACTVYTTASQDGTTQPTLTAGGGWYKYSAATDQGLVRGVSFAQPADGYIAIDNITLNYDT